MIDNVAHNKLDAPLTVEEIKIAIKSMQSGSSPGPDGLPIELYKTYADKLAPSSVDMFNDALQSHILSLSLRQASISLILKKDKNLLDCGSYRPISLLGANVKNSSKSPHLHTRSSPAPIICIDQTGFVKGSLSSCSIKRMMDIIYSPSESKDPEILLLLDAEKVFDHVEWVCLFHTLCRFGFGDNFIKWMELLYTSPLASVRTHDVRPPYFPLQRNKTRLPTFASSLCACNRTTRSLHTEQFCYPGYCSWRCGTKNLPIHR